METQTLRPRRERIEINGKISYGDSVGAWNKIRFKKELIKEFPQLKEKVSKFNYKMILYPDYEDLERAVRKIKKEKEAIPILLWFGKEKKA
ncbi:MAG: hypothetical protein WC494_03170 [Candidatus Pacearchaeota archaeon]